MGSVFCSYIIDNRVARLRTAIDEANEKKIQELVKDHDDIINTECDRYGNTPLIYAVQNAKLDAVRTLLELGADANKNNSSTFITPVHTACTLRTLKSSPSVYNVSFPSQNVVTKTDSQTSEVSRTSSTARVITVENSNVIQTPITNAETISGIISLLAKHGADVNKAIATERLDIYGSHIKTTKLTPLMFAIEQRNMAAIDALIAAGVDINYQDNESHMCALHLACGLGNAVLIKKLLDNGGNAYLKSRDGNSSLHWLALNNKDEITCLMIILQHSGFSININLQNENGQTPLMLAAQKGKQSMAKTLLDNGSRMEIKDKKNLTAMEYANDESCKNLLRSFQNFEKITRKLSKSKLSLNLSNPKDKFKRSAISLSNVSRSYDTLSIVEEDFTNRVMDEKKIAEEAEPKHLRV